jgi:uncharacterized oxidoreductase
MSMNIKGNTVLITGGATGIGLALAQVMVKAGNKVIICGRREIRLNEAKEAIPAIYIHKCDVTLESDRDALLEWVNEDFGDLNILINNAGIQKKIDFTSGAQGLFSRGDELTTNLAAPIYMTAQFLPLLMLQKEAAVVNVSSGLGFVPIAAMPVYCATKAALHSFSVSLRHQLRETTVKVFELIPPAVETELGMNESDDEQNYPGIKPSIVAQAALDSLAKNEYEIPVGGARELVLGSCLDFKKTFDSINPR